MFEVPDDLLSNYKSGKKNCGPAARRTILKRTARQKRIYKTIEN